MSFFLSTHSGVFHKVRFDPVFDPLQVQVDANKAELPTPLDQLIWLHHQPLNTKHTHKNRSLNSKTEYYGHHKGKVNKCIRIKL